jgi:hypothetical protein
MISLALVATFAAFVIAAGHRRGSGPADVRRFERAVPVHARIAEPSALAVRASR